MKITPHMPVTFNTWLSRINTFISPANPALSFSLPLLLHCTSRSSCGWPLRVPLEQCMALSVASCLTSFYLKTKGPRGKIVSQAVAASNQIHSLFGASCQSTIASGRRFPGFLVYTCPLLVGWKMPWLLVIGGLW